MVTFNKINCNRLLKIMKKWKNNITDSENKNFIKKFSEKKHGSINNSRAMLISIKEKNTWKARNLKACNLSLKFRVKRKIFLAYPIFKNAS